MKMLQTRSWGVAARLVAIALVPAVLMMFAVNASLYWSAQDEVTDDIRDRGRLIAAALAEGSQYGVISGNVAMVEQAARGLMATEPSLAFVKVFDAQRTVMVAIGAPPSVSGVQTFEVPVASGALSLNLFDTTGAGDLFAAGFLAGEARGLGLERSLRLGAICAAEVIQHYGARPEASLKALAGELLG